MVKGHATPEGTRTRFSGLQSFQARTLGRTGWQVSPVGFGCYRVQEDVERHREAMAKALLSGCNLIDTSTNYGLGSSERLVGRVLRDLIGAGKLKREQVVVVTKIGYVQGDNIRLAAGREKVGRPFPEMVKYSDDCWHCISPEYLEDQLNRSLERLGLERVDALLLHNPEYFLKAQDDHIEYYRRIKKAFEYLESEVDRGRIQYYGISSNTFPEPKESSEFTSLERVWELAQEIGPGNRFGVIQFPFNLFEAGAAFEHNNGARTVAEFAREKGLGTLVNRPLNSFRGRRMIRLASFSAASVPEARDRLKRAFQDAIELEGAFPLADAELRAAIGWGHILYHNLEKIGDLDHWKSLLEFRIRPEWEEVAAALAERPEARDWLPKQSKAVEELFAAFTGYLEARVNQQSQEIVYSLERESEALKSSATLSQIAIRIYRSLPGLDCILVGMRDPKYVADVMKLDPPIPEEDARSAIEAVNELELVDLNSLT